MLRTMCHILFSAPEDKQRKKGNLPGGVGVLGRWTIRTITNKLPDRLGVGKCYGMGAEAGSTQDRKV